MATLSIKDIKKDYVINTAIELFLDNPIANITVKDIAKASSLGEATIYRYFSTKAELVSACALKLQAETEDMFIERKEQFSSGYEALERFYYMFLETFKKNARLYYFLSEFDAYCINNKIENQTEYADNMDKFKEYYIEKYKTGLIDKSVKKSENIEMFYYATTHAILSLCKKLSANHSVLRQDKCIDKCAEIEMLIKTVLFSLKATV